MSAHADVIYGVNPSGKRAIDELRDYAFELPEHIGPCFGRDVVQMLDALMAEDQHLRQALAQILDEAGAYHGSPNRKDNALHAITVKARTALDGTL